MYGQSLSPIFALALLGYLGATVALKAQSADDVLQEAEASSDKKDITNIILTERSPDCGTYALAYTSEVTALQQQKAFDGALIVSAEDDSCTLTSNGIPNHDFGGGSERPFATPVAAIGATFNIPRKPKAASVPTPLSHRTFDAVLLNGVVVDILSAGCYDPNGRRPNRDGNVLAGCRDTVDWLIDPMSPLAPFAEDDHHGHPQPDGRYHYHGNPMALFDDNPTPDGSPLIGFAADGFPIYGPYIKDETGKVRKVTSGYSLKEGNRPTGDGNPGGSYDGLYRADWEFTGNGDLDACNGMTHNGTYAYYVIDTFPWMIACHTGTPDSSFVRPGLR